VDSNAEQHLSIEAPKASLHFLELGERAIPIDYARNRRARRYIIRLAAGGRLRVTIPPFGSKGEAYAFAERERRWIERQLNKPSLVQVVPAWTEGTPFLFRGEWVALRFDPTGCTISFADQKIPCPSPAPSDFRRLIEWHLAGVAARELGPRTLGLAQQHGLSVRGVTIRAQRSRWGSCSPKGTVSLNWRLIQMPVFVSDYVILHELMHLRQMNHSKAFWRWVEAVCPDYRVAERWIKEHSDHLRCH